MGDSSAAEMNALAAGRGHNTVDSWRQRAAVEGEQVPQRGGSYGTLAQRQRSFPPPAPSDNLPGLCVCAICVCNLHLDLRARVECIMGAYVRLGFDELRLHASSARVGSG